MTVQTTLPDDVWIHVASFLSLPLSSGRASPADCRAFACLALVSRALFIGTRAARQHTKNRVHVVKLTTRCELAPMPHARHVRVLAFVDRNAGVCIPRPICWATCLEPFAKLAWLDLSRMHDERAPAVLKAASELCRHVRALALPDPELQPATWGQPMYGLYEQASEALRRWRAVNGGLRYLSLGRLAMERLSWIELVGRCPKLEVLEAPSSAILRCPWTTSWTACWRACSRLRKSNFALPVFTRADLDQFAVVPKPQLTHLCLNGFNFAWAADEDHVAALAAFVRTVPSLQSLRLEARPQRRLQPIDVLICHALTQCPRLESVTVVATASPPKIHHHRPTPGHHLPTPGPDIALVSPRGLVALAGCGSVDQIRLDRVALDTNTLGDMVQHSIASRAGRLRSVLLNAFHVDRDVLAVFLHFLATLDDTEVAKLRLAMRVANDDARVGLCNRACDEREVLSLVVAVLSRRGIRVRVDLQTPVLADFVTDRSGFVVAAIEVNVNAWGVAHENGVFVDGTKVRVDEAAILHRPHKLP